MKAVKVSGSCLKSEESFLKSVACFCSEKPALGYFTFSQYLSEAKASLHIVAIFPLRTFTYVSCWWSIYQPALSTTQGLLHSIRPQRCYLFPFASLLEVYVLGKSVGKNPLSTPVRCQRPSTNWHSNICNTYSNNKISTVLHVGFFSSLTDEQQWLVTWVCHQLKCTLDQRWPVTYHYWEKLAVGHVLDERDFFTWP